MKGLEYFDGQRILATDLSYEHDTKEAAIKERMIDCFSPGVVFWSDGVTPFHITANAITNYHFDIGIATGYTDTGDKVVIDDFTSHDATKPIYDIDGVCVPQSSGNLNVGLNNYAPYMDNHVYLRYLETRDSDVRALNTESGEIVYPRVQDGYYTEVTTTIPPTVGLSNSIYIGTITAQGCNSSIATAVDQSKMRALSLKTPVTSWDFAQISTVDVGTTVLASQRAGGVDIVYAGSTTIYKSIDGAKTWTSVHTPATTSIAILAYSHGYVLVGDNVGAINRSTDYGDSWTTGVGALGSEIDNFVYLGNGIVLAAGDIIMRSTNFGASWDTVVGSVNSAFVANIGEGIAFYVDTVDGKVYRSTDYGLNWNQVGIMTGMSTWSASAFIGLEDTKTLLFANGVYVQRSTDQGASWDKTLMISPTFGTRLFDVHYLGDGGVIASGGGTYPVIYKSSDWGRTWRLVQNLDTTGTNTTVVRVTSLTNGVIIGGVGTNTDLIFATPEITRAYNTTY